MSKLMINIKRSLAIISDTHVGSRCALFPDKYTTKEGNIVRANAGQLEIFKYSISRTRISFLDMFPHVIARLSEKEISLDISGYKNKTQPLWKCL